MYNQYNQYNPYQYAKQNSRPIFIPSIMARTAEVGITPAQAYINSIYNDYQEALQGGHNGTNLMATNSK